MSIKSQLQKFKKEFKLRDDWHEPDEQGVSARVFENHFSFPTR